MRTYSAIMRVAYYGGIAAAVALALFGHWQIAVGMVAGFALGAFVGVAYKLADEAGEVE